MRSSNSWSFASTCGAIASNFSRSGSIVSRVRFASEAIIVNSARKVISPGFATVRSVGFTRWSREGAGTSPCHSLPVRRFHGGSLPSVK